MHQMEGLMKKRKAWKKRGPIPPAGGRVRITVNLPRALLPFVLGRDGVSVSTKIVGLIQAFKEDCEC